MLSITWAYSQQTHILLDYDAVDEYVVSDSLYLREFWVLNSNFPDNNLVRGLSWAVVKFDTLYDADSYIAYTYHDKALIIDSVRLSMMHQNVTGTPDTVIVSIYDYEGTTGVSLDPQQQIANTVLYDTMIVTTVSLTDPFQVGSITIRPGLQLTAGQKFLAGVHFYGDLFNTFNLLTGYSDLCGQACLEPSASPSVFASNSIYRIIYWDGPQRFTGVNSVAFDCDSDLIAGEPQECELFTIQNIAIKAYVSFESETTSIAPQAAASASFRFFPNPTHDIVYAELSDVSPAVQVAVFDTKGRKLLSEPCFSPSGNRFEIKLGKVPAGIYILAVTDNRYKASFKLIKN